MTEKITPSKETEKQTRPADVPEKFWNEETGKIRTGILLKSYMELEKKLGASHLISREELTTKDKGLINKILGVPETVEEINNELTESGLEADPEVNEKLLAANFTKDQIKLVYNLAEEKLAPIAEEMTENLRHQTELKRLHDYFGSEDRFNEVSHQILAFGRKKMSESSLDTICQNADGIISLYEMMKSKEPKIIKEGTAVSDDLNEEGLKKMMQDPRYWRDQDSEYAEKIRSGFEKIYKKENEK